MSDNYPYFSEAEMAAKVALAKAKCNLLGHQWEVSEQGDDDWYFACKHCPEFCFGDDRENLPDKWFAPEPIKWKIISGGE